MSLQEAQQFVAQFIRGEYTPVEHAAFLQWLKGATIEELAVVAEMHESMHGEWVLMAGPSTAWVAQLERKLDESEEVTVGDDREAVMVGEGSAGGIRMRPEWKRRWNVWIAAAAVVVLLGMGTYIYVQRVGLNVGKPADREKLLSMAFVNPRGGAQREMVLGDGSKVWLNAGSVLKYPQRFTGSERLVELSGEAFFEVAGNSGRPFRVLIKDGEVEVLGTFFTIMAYEDEPENRTAVVNGTVKVTAGQQSVIVQPGEAAEISYPSPGESMSSAGAVPVVHSIDLSIVKAWKNGIYRFRSTELSTIMREIARAYDVTVEVKPGVGSRQIDGSLDLNKTLDITLEQLNGLTEVYKIQVNHKGKTVIASSI